MSEYKKGFDVVDCVEDNNFLSGDILFVRGTVTFNDHQKVFHIYDHQIFSFLYNQIL